MKDLIEKNKKIVLGLVFILAFFLITFRFTDTPKVWIDEGIFTNVAETLSSQGHLGVQTAPNKYFPLGVILTANYPVVYPIALSFSLFDVGVFQARLPMLIYMFALVLLFFLFANKRYGFNIAILSVLFLLSFSPFYGNGRSVLGEVPGLVFLVLGSLLLFYCEESNFNSKKLTIFSGLAFGLAASTKPIFLILLVPSLVLVAVFWFKKIKDKKIIPLFALSFLVPLVFWFFINFPTKELVSQIIPTILNQGGGDLPFAKTILTNFSKFFKETTPILFMLVLISVLASFFLKIWKNKYRGFSEAINQSFSASEFLILIFILLNWFSYLRGTGWYRYFFGAQTLLYLLFPAAIFGLREFFQNKILKQILFVIPILLLVFQFYHLVFLSQTSFTVNRERNSELAKEISQIDSTKKVLFYNAVETVVFLKSNHYDQYLSMNGLFEAGNKEALINPKYDYIVITHYQNYNFPLPCYTEKKIDRYSLFTRKGNCGGKP